MAAKNGWANKPKPGPTLTHDEDPERLLDTIMERRVEQAANRPAWIEQRFQTLRRDHMTRRQVFDQFVQMDAEVLSYIHWIMDNPSDVEELRSVLVMAIHVQSKQNGTQH